MKRWVYRKLGIISPSLYYSDEKYREKVNNSKLKSERFIPNWLMYTLGIGVVIIWILLYMAG